MVTLEPLRALVLGYGNVDRQDDGVAWHVITHLAEKLDIQIPKTPDEVYLIESQCVDLLFQLQLYPELADLLKGYSRVCFIDAHTGAIPENVHIEQIYPQIHRSSFTHHLTPHSLISLTSTLFNHTPDAVLISVRGHEFDFSTRLSHATSELVSLAVDQIISWLFP